MLYRFIALCIDLILVHFIAGFLGEIWLGSFNLFSQHFIIGITYLPAVFIFYFILFDLLFEGRSIGKIVCNIKVIKETAAPTLLIRIKRSTLKLLSFTCFIITLVLYLIYGWVFHEHFTDTKTIKEK